MRDMKKWLCIICGLIYDEAQGWPADGILPGTRWEDVPEDWVCPDCLVGKADFEMMEITQDDVQVASHVELIEQAQPIAAQDLKSDITLKPIVIIGSGHSGYQVAAALRKQSSTVPITVITADNGALYSKPALSNSFALGKSCDDLQNESALEWEQRLNIRVYPHTRVEKIDRNKQTLNTNIGSYEYSKLVLATGASAIKIPIAGDCSNVLSINDLTDYRCFKNELTGKKRIAILGDGLIGCEFANDLSASGYDVSVIGLGKWPIERLIPQILGERLKKSLTDIGVSWFLEDSISHIDAEPDGSSQLHLQSGKVIEADLVISAVGLKPNTALAEQAGLEVGRGIKVNDYGQTSDETIFSLGDCAETSQGWQPFIAPINQLVPSLVSCLLGDLTKAIFTRSPVIVKTPIMPLSIYPAAVGALGEWQIEQIEDGLTARFYSVDGLLLGFALLGKQAQINRSHLLEQLNTKQLTVAE